MSTKDKGMSMFNKYFSDYFKWNIAVAAVFIISYVLGLNFGSTFGKYWIIPVIYLVILSLSAKYHILFFTALKDLKRKQIEEASVHVRRIVSDKQRNYTSKNGAIFGNEKCLLLDSGGSEYRVILNSGHRAESRSSEYYCNAQVIVEYLAGSRIVIHMKTVSSDDAAAHLREDFSEYFA